RRCSNGSRLFEMAACRSSTRRGFSCWTRAAKWKLIRQTVFIAGWAGLLAISERDLSVPWAEMTQRNSSAAFLPVSNSHQPTSTFSIRLITIQSKSVWPVSTATPDGSPRGDIMWLTISTDRRVGMDELPPTTQSHFKLALIGVVLRLIDLLSGEEVLPEFPFLQSYIDEAKSLGDTDPRRGCLAGQWQELLARWEAAVPCQLPLRALTAEAGLSSDALAL